MAKRVVNNFNAGELSPYLDARSDLEKYGNGCIKLENFVPLPYGGVKRRPGLKFLGEAYGTGQVRMIPFLASIEDSYVLEIGDGYGRVWKGEEVLEDDDGNPVLIDLPYGAEDIRELKYAQSIDVLWVVHPDYPVRKISRVSATQFISEPEVFDFPPLNEQNQDQNILVWPSAVTGSITLESNVDLFDVKHIDSYMALKSIRTSSSQKVAGTLSTTGFSDSINMSFSNWKFTTSGTFRADIVIQRSNDNGRTWIDYVQVGNTADVASGAERNFLASSSQPEPANTLLRVRFRNHGETVINYELLAESINIESIVLITGIADSKKAYATVVSRFQDVPSEYVSWDDLSGTIAPGVKVVASGGLESTGDPDVDLNAVVLRSFRNLNSGVWEESGSKAGEFYWVAYDNQPAFTEPAELHVDGDGGTVKSGTLGSLTSGQWNWGDNDTLGYGTLYYKPANELNPDFKEAEAIYGEYSSAVTSGIDSVVALDYGRDLGENADYLYVADGTSATVYKFTPDASILVSVLDLSSVFGQPIYISSITILDGRLHVAWGESITPFNRNVNILIDDFSDVYDEGKAATFNVIQFSNLGVVAADNKIIMSFNSFGAASATIQTRNPYTYAIESSFTVSTGHIKSMAVSSGKIYAACADNLMRVFSFSGTLLETTDISLLDYDGLAASGTDFFLAKADGTVSFFEFGDEKYYERVKSDTKKASFAAEYQLGYWAEREPKTYKWSEGAFSVLHGYPASIALFENRLCYGGTLSNPDTLFLSAIDDYANFNLGSLDTDAMRLTLNNGQLDSIRWLVPREVLGIGTVGSEWDLGAADERKAVTPTSFSLKRKSTYGTSSLQGMLVSNAIVYAMRQGKKIREWVHSYDGNDPSADMTILAEHMLQLGVVEWAYQQQPDSIVWMVRTDGTLVGATYERDQNVIAFHRHNNDEFLFESVTTIAKDGEEDEVWLSIKIEVDGDDKRYICRMDDREWGTDYKSEWKGSDLYVDADSNEDIFEGGVVVSGAGTEGANGEYEYYDLNLGYPVYIKGDVEDFENLYYITVAQVSEDVFAWYILLGNTVLYEIQSVDNEDGSNSLPKIPPPTGWTAVGEAGTPPTLSYISDTPLMVSGSYAIVGLGYLEGKTVAVVCDGVVQTPKTVENGTIVLDDPGYDHVTIGLNFVSTLAPMYVEAEYQFGTSKGSMKKVRKAVVRFKDTFSAKAGSSESRLEKVKFDPDSDPLYSGDFKTWFGNASGYLQTCYIVQDEPMPCEVLCIIPEVEV